MAGHVIRQCEREHDEEPEERRDHRHHGQLGAVTQVHEEEHDQSTLDGGNQQRHDDVEDAQVDRGREYRQAGAHHQRGPDANVKTDRYNMRFWRDVFVFRVIHALAMLLADQIEQRE